MTDDDKPKICISDPEKYPIETFTDVVRDEPIVIGIVGRGHDTVIEQLKHIDGVQIIMFDELSDIQDYQIPVLSLHDIVNLKCPPEPVRYSEMLKEEPVKKKFYHNSPTIKRRDFKKKR